MKEEEETKRKTKLYPLDKKLEANLGEMAQINDREYLKDPLQHSFSPNPFISIMDFHNSVHAMNYVNKRYFQSSINNYEYICKMQQRKSKYKNKK